MTAIYKKELKSYLTSMIGYLFMAFTLALFGLYFTAINLQQGYPEIGYALQNSAFILLIAVPVLTMSCRRSRKIRRISCSLPHR